MLRISVSLNPNSAASGPGVAVGVAVGVVVGVAVDVGVAVGVNEGVAVGVAVSVGRGPKEPFTAGVGCVGVGVGSDARAVLSGVGKAVGLQPANSSAASPKRRNAPEKRGARRRVR